MTKFKTNKKALAFKGAAVLIIAALLALVFTACKQPAGAESDGDSSGGGHTGPNYVKVRYSELEDYLKDEALEGEVNYIEVIGDIPKEDFKGTLSPLASGELGKRIKSFPDKEVALKIEKYPDDLTDMEYCFATCENLISLANLPEKNITSMKGCFGNCTKLTRVPNIPEGVKDMATCFIFTKLTIGPDIPASVEKMNGCFGFCINLEGVKLKCNYNPNEIDGEKAFKSAFFGCNALNGGGIKVPSGQLAAYTEDDAIKIMFGDGCDVEAQKKKFAEYTP